jgi:peptidyl-prolyl cis-trans isomerase A (cyclophilin A)
MNRLAVPTLFGLLTAVCSCESRPPEPEPFKPAPNDPLPYAAEREAANKVTEPVAQKPPDRAPAPAAGPKATAAVPVSPDDPLKGTFTLEDATRGLPKQGKLVADIQTSDGKLECELYEDKAPITVANIVGLARGLRPFKAPDGKWVKRPGYDGTTFHRIIKGFMIQGGDPGGNGAGEPGYVIPDEVWEGARHDRRGLLCMANRGPNTNGMQFFITDGAAPHLDRGYTIFGECKPDSVIEKLAGAPVRGDRAVDPPKITKVTVRRRK